MRSAIDTSVLFAIFADEPSAEAWMKNLIAARREGQLVICEIVYAELAPAFSTSRELDAALFKLGVSYDEISKETAFAAGKIFLKYRSAGGPRKTIIPDFLIAAHASLQADRLLAADRGYARQYFPSLKIVDR